MSKNPLYANEIATAHQFVIEHNNDIDFMNFLREIRENKNLIVTGLAYYLED